MNEIVNKYLLAGDKFMPKMRLKQPGFTYTACGPFTKNKERIQIFKETGVQTIFTKMNLIRLVFNMIWHMEILKDLKRRIASDKILRYRAFNIAKNAKYDEYQTGLASMVYTFLRKSPQLAYC